MPHSLRLVGAGIITVLALSTLTLRATSQVATPPAEVSFTKHIAPILQRSCENCHRPDGVAPMSLRTYEEVRPWARAIKQRTGLGPRAGVMPPWYVEKNIGIQKFKNDPSLSDSEVALIAKWADSGAPRGEPADMPPARVWNDSTKWSIGTPDLVVRTTDILVKATAPDWWGEIPRVPIPLDEDRYVSAVEIKEVNDAGSTGTGRDTVGGRFVFHHMIWSTRVLGEQARDPNVPDDSTSWPMHGARLEIAFKFMPRGYKPEYRRATYALGNGVDIDIRAMEPNQQLHAYALLKENTKILSFEPHLHAPGARMCLEAIWGYTIQTINCVGYDHNWVRGYDYDDDHAPLLPKDTILHIVGYMDNSPSNKNVPDPRNWQGSGNRSVANMFIDLGNRVFLTDEQFQAEMAARREKLKLTRNSVAIGCPLCNVLPQPPAATRPQQ